MIMNDGMTSRRVMRACFAVAALALLACAQGCGESARPGCDAGRRIRICGDAESHHDAAADGCAR